MNDALRLKRDQDRRLAALVEFVTAYEAEYGAITADEIRQAARRADASAVVVRGARSAVTTARGGRRRQVQP